MLEIITRPDEVSPEWMTRALKRAGHLAKGKVVSLEHRIIGTGKMGDNARFTLRYEHESADASKTLLGPKTVVGKFPAADETARVMAGAQGAYYNEVMFYRHLAGRTAMRTPLIYANEISDDRQAFTLLMEDLAPAEPGSQLVGATLEQTRLAMCEAAKLAAAFYGDEPVGDYDYVMSPARDGGGALAQEYLQQMWPTFLERFGHAIDTPCREFGARYVNVHNHFANRFQGPKTLAHGDFRSENILFHGDRCCTVDWQTAMETSPVTDIAYFLGSSTEVEDRRNWERDIIREYSEQLACHGVDLGFDECWTQYREQAMHGLMITILGASFSSPEERSDAMFRTLLQRQLQHCIDLDAGDFLR